MAQQNRVVGAGAEMSENQEVSLRLGLRDADRANEIVAAKMRRAAKRHQTPAASQRLDRERILPFHHRHLDLALEIPIPVHSTNS